MHGSATPDPAPRSKRAARAFWLKQLHSWHWISSAVALVGLLLFTLTGLTLNHAGQIEGRPVSVDRQGQLPASLHKLVEAPEATAETTDDKVEKPLPAAISSWIETKLGVGARGSAEWSADEIYLSAPRPGGDGWVSIDRVTGEVQSETTSRGWIAYLNDLHKGRNTGAAWSWFIDIFAIASLLFAFTGLVLLWLHSHRRPSTWPLVGLGLLIPLILALFFVH